MAPTTLPGMYSSSTPDGRDPALAGNPIRVCEMLSTLDGPAYIARVSVHNPSAVTRTKKAIKLAFKTQLASLGMALVEVLSPCPVGWKMEPVESLQWMKEHMLPYYPLGEFKITEAVQALKRETRRA